MPMVARIAPNRFHAGAMEPAAATSREDAGECQTKRNSFNFLLDF